MGYYGDNEVHRCPKCGHKGTYLDFDPVLKPGKPLFDGTQTEIVGFGCRCGFAFWEEDGEITSKGQSRLSDFVEKARFK